MRINDDFSARTVVHAARSDWVPSPMAGVERRMLDRIGDEVARATTIVRFAPGSAFSAHEHGGGEEFLVLDGVFQDEHADYPAGTYVRNPPGTSHTPATAPGCTILVKLHQFDPDDRAQFSVETAGKAGTPDPDRPGVSVQLLHEDARERVTMEDWAPGTRVAQDLPGGAELFVIAGGFAEGGEAFEPHSWLRLPVGSRLEAEAGPEGARVWVKTGHLAHLDA